MIVTLISVLPFSSQFQSFPPSLPDRLVSLPLDLRFSFPTILLSLQTPYLARIKISLPFPKFMYSYFFLHMHRLFLLILLRDSNFSFTSFIRVSLLLPSQCRDFILEGCSSSQRLFHLGRTFPPRLFFTCSLTRRRRHPTFFLPTGWTVPHPPLFIQL